MKTNTKLTIAATLGVVTLGATLVGAVPALAAGTGTGGGAGLQSGVCQTASALSSGAARVSAPAACAGFVDADGDGICDNRGTGTGGGNGAGYVDADGDGVCDNYGTGAGNGYGNGSGAGDGNGYGAGTGNAAGGGHHGGNAGGHHGKGHGRC